MEDQDPCQNCGTPMEIQLAVKVNGEHYCSEFCAQTNTPVIGGHSLQYALAEGAD